MNIMYFIFGTIVGYIIAKLLAYIDKRKQQVDDEIKEILKDIDKSEKPYKESPLFVSITIDGRQFDAVSTTKNQIEIHQTFSTEDLAFFSDWHNLSLNNYNKREYVKDIFFDISDRQAIFKNVFVISINSGLVLLSYDYIKMA